MSDPREGDQRPYEEIAGRNGHVHYDTRVDDWRMRTQILREAGRLRRQTGAIHLEVIPHRWMEDKNFDSITIRGDGVNRVYKRAPRGNGYRLQPEPQTKPR